MCYSEGSGGDFRKAGPKRLRGAREVRASDSSLGWLGARALSTRRASIESGASRRKRPSVSVVSMSSVGGSFETLNPPATRERMDAGAWTYIDVRTVEEFDQGHVPGSWNVPFAFRDPTEGMVPNPEFVAAIKRHFATDSHLVFG